VLSLVASFEAAACPPRELRLANAWGRWVGQACNFPRPPEPDTERADARPLGDYDAARDALAEVSSRIVRLYTGLPSDVRDGLLATLAGHERTVVALLDRYMRQRGRGR